MLEVFRVYWISSLLIQRWQTEQAEVNLFDEGSLPPDESRIGPTKVPGRHPETEGVWGAGGERVVQKKTASNVSLKRLNIFVRAI